MGIWGIGTWGSGTWGSPTATGPDILGIISKSNLGEQKASHLGGEEFILFGRRLNDFSANDDFKSGALDAGLWSDISAGSGALSFSVLGTLLSTGVTAGSIAGIDGTVLYNNDIDAVVSYDVQTDIEFDPPASKVILALLELENASNSVVISREYDPAQFGNQISVIVDGIVTAIKATSGNSGTLRILRAGTSVYFFHDSDLILKHNDWTLVGVSANMRVNNIADVYDVSTIISDYVRAPVITFGGEACTDLDSFRTTRLFGTFPAYLNVTGEDNPVDIEVSTASNLTDTLLSSASNFSYVIANQFKIQSSPLTGIDIMNDPVLRNIQTNTPGFEQGGKR